MSELSLVYVSTAIHPMSNNELQDLLISARRKNKRQDITGMLLYKDSFFIQALEGKVNDITHLFNRIKQDPRHENVTLIYSEPLKERAFSDWSMGFYTLGDTHIQHMEGYTNFLSNPSYDFFASNLHETKELLLKFRGESSL